MHVTNFQKSQHMFRICLINMPFASVNLPSIALTQLQAMLSRSSNSSVTADIYYLNHDFFRYFGGDTYNKISSSVNVNVSGFGDWLFRQVAFPDEDDNAEQYIQRYRRQLGNELLDQAKASRPGLDDFIDELILRYRLNEYDLVGFTSMFTQNVASFAMARKLKQYNPAITTVIGGANCETTMGSVIARNADAIDFVFSGPALRTFPEFVQHLANDEVSKCHNISGVFSKKRLDRILLGQLEEIGEELDIDEVVQLDYTGFLASLDRKCPGMQPSLLFETSRGCWWGERSHCTFCGLNSTTMKYRHMSPERALAQFDRLFKYYPKVSRFKSVDNIMPRKYLKNVFPLIKQPPNASIFYEVKADLKEHEVQTLAEAGVLEIQPGIEALATSTLKLMGKGTNAFQNLRFLKYCLTYGVKPVWNLLIGFPGEEEAIYQKYAVDIPLLTHLPPPSGVYTVRFDRYSPYYSLARNYGLKLKPYDFYALVYPFPEQDLEDLAYFFADQNYSNAYIEHAGKWLKKLSTKVDGWNNRWNQRNEESQPRLAFEWCGNTRCVHDTRLGTGVYHKLSPAAMALLEEFANPLSLERAAEKHSNLSESALERLVKELCDGGLLFEEQGRYMSLVVDYGREAGFL